MQKRLNKFTILYLHDVIQIGGAERSIYYLIKNLDRERFLPVAVLPSEGPFMEDLKGLGVEIHFMDFPRPLDINIFNKFKTINKLISIVKSKNIDLIHSNGFRTNLYGGIAGRITGKKVVWHARNLITTERLDPDRLFIFLPHRIICLTEAIRGRFHKDGMPHRKSIVIQNGVDTEEFNPGISGEMIRKEFGISAETLLIGVTSRIVPEKGHDIFLKAAGIVSEEFLEARFLIVGSHISPEFSEWEGYIKRLAVETGLSDKVIFTGFRKDLPQILAAMDVFVLPSYAEPSGRSHLEAMAMGKPIVATRSGGTPEIAVDRVTAILVDPGNHKAMAAAIISLLRNPERMSDMGRKARERAENHFSIKSNAKETEKLYLKLLDTRAKVLQVIHSSELSGPQRHIIDIAKAIDKNNFQLEVACPDGWLYRELKKNDVITHKVELKDSLSIRSLLSLYRIAREGRFDIIHAHMGRTGFYAKLVGVMTGIPVIVTEHLVAHDHSWIRNPLKRKLHLMGHRFSNRMARFVIAVSKEARDSYIERQGISPEKVVIIHNFVDTGIVPSEEDVAEIRRELGINKDSFVIGFLGRLDWRKGLKTIIDAAHEIRGGKFLIVGDGEARDEFKVEIRKKGLDQYFILTGLRQDVAALLKAMDIFIFPTEYESFGIAVIEAMAAGKPVIASDLGPLREIITDGENGILIPPKDPYSLRSGIERLMRDTGLMRQLGENGKRTVNEKFSLKKGIKKIEGIYEGVIGR